MKRNPLKPIRKLVIIAGIVLPTVGSSQLNTFWNTNGNSSVNGNFIGTTNNEPLIFKTNSLEALRIKTNGEIKVTAFESIGKGVVTFNNNGVLTTRVFPNDTNQVFCGSGNFKSIAALSGWTRSGNVLYNSTGVNVGIGTSNPQYALDVVGSASFTGTVSAQGVILTNKLLADTMKAAQMLSLNNNMHLSGGGINQIYTSTGDLRIQSNSNVNASNLILSAGTNGNVGIGTFSPQYKLDVAGSVRVTEAILTKRIKPLAGDTVIAFGDSTIYMSINNRIWPGAFGNIKGMSIGNSTSTGNGLYSLAIGSKVVTTPAANYAIAMGSGVVGGSGVLVNTIPNSLMVGFNSDKPTFFVEPATGAGTTGAVAIADTYIPSGFKFAVNGKIIAEEVNVKLRGSWPDSVFSPNYSLMSLPDLAMYVDTAHHLPGVPSAQQMKEQQTFAVGEMEVILLAKMEEMTLYMIQLQQQNDALRREIDAMKNEEEPK